MHDRRNNCYPKAGEWSGWAWEVNSIYHAKSAAKRSEIKGTDNAHRGPLQAYGEITGTEKKIFSLTDL